MVLFWGVKQRGPKGGQKGPGLNERGPSQAIYLYLNNKYSKVVVGQWLDMGRHREDIGYIVDNERTVGSW